MRLPAEIDRILTRLDQYRCRQCDQLCYVPHVAAQQGSRDELLSCRPLAPLPPGFPGAQGGMVATAR